MTRRTLSPRPVACVIRISSARRIVGFARTPLTDAAFRARIKKGLKGDGTRRDDFLRRCFYRRGPSYGDTAAWRAVAADLAGWEGEAARGGSNGGANGGGDGANRLCYLAVPPHVFVSAVAGMRAAGILRDAPSAASDA